MNDSLFRLSDRGHKINDYQCRLILWNSRDPFHESIGAQTRSGKYLLKYFWSVGRYGYASDKCGLSKEFCDNFLRSD